jgi:glycosyltransferase involved in cell wall biosynthesis
VLKKLAEKHEFVLRIVGAGRAIVYFEGLRIENAEWRLENEVEDFQRLDIGLYPLVPSNGVSREWIMGKSGFKAIQYMAVGVPFVMTPIGVCEELGEAGKTHFNARGEDEWFEALEALLADESLRKRMGAYGREHSVANYTISTQADRLAGVLRRAAGQSS